jgi:hypothetical protein
MLRWDGGVGLATDDRGLRPGVPWWARAPKEYGNPERDIEASLHRVDLIVAKHQMDLQLRALDHEVGNCRTQLHRSKWHGCVNPQQKLFRIGQIVPSSNTTMETEIPAMLNAHSVAHGTRFTFHSSRMRMKTVKKEELAEMDAESDRYRSSCRTPASTYSVTPVSSPSSAWASRTTGYRRNGFTAAPPKTARQRPWLPAPAPSSMRLGSWEPSGSGWGVETGTHALLLLFGGVYRSRRHDLRDAWGARAGPSA